MFNSRLINPHDVIIIGAIAVIVHVILVPLYVKFENGASADSEA